MQKNRLKLVEMNFPYQRTQGSDIFICSVHVRDRTKVRMLDYIDYYIYWAEKPRDQQHLLTEEFDHLHFAGVYLCGIDEVKDDEDLIKKIRKLLSENFSHEGQNDKITLGKYTFHHFGRVGDTWTNQDQLERIPDIIKVCTNHYMHTPDREEDRFNSELTDRQEYFC